MIVKEVEKHLVVHSPFCGEIREILKNDDYPPLGIAVAINIGVTHAHYHLTFDEIYFVLDGELTIRTYNPTTGAIALNHLKANELCVITKGIHHKIVEASPKNRLCVITVPPFHADDEHPSTKI
jgi:mannose-6-phosphate isomerase-like protein (cupin superfamily)